MVDLQEEESIVLLRTWDRNGCPPVCSHGSVCKSCSIVPLRGILEVFNFDRSAVHNGTPKRQGWLGAFFWDGVSDLARLLKRALEIGIGIN